MCLRLSKHSTDVGHYHSYGPIRGRPPPAAWDRLGAGLPGPAGPAAGVQSRAKSFPQSQAVPQVPMGAASLSREACTQVAYEDAHYYYDVVAMTTYDYIEISFNCSFQISSSFRRKLTKIPFSLANSLGFGTLLPLSSEISLWPDSPLSLALAACDLRHRAHAHC